MSVEAKRRYAEANEHVAAGRLDDATAQFVWLWQNIVAEGPSLVGVRVSFMANQMQSLARRHPPAREQFLDLREELAPSVDGGAAMPTDLQDWSSPEVGALHAALRAAGRNADALAVLDEARRLMPGAQLEASIADALKAARIEATTDGDAAP
jgi:hypothetical protein